MTIVCGTDFSQASNDAGRTAAALARRRGDALRLVHVVQELGLDLQLVSLNDIEYNPVRAMLHSKAEALRADGTQVEEMLMAGRPDEVLGDIATHANPWLVVVSSVGRGVAARWLLGSVSERTAQSCPAPVLVVRNPSALQAWASGGTPLRVLVGVDRTIASRSAYRWAQTLRQLGPCEVIAAHVAWPPGEQARMGLHGPIALDRLEPAVEQAVVSELKEHLGEPGGAEDVEVSVQAGMGRVDSHLSLWAEAARADLIVVGSNHRSGVDRILHGAVSRGLLHLARTNVVCVPTTEVAVDRAG